MRWVNFIRMDRNCSVMMMKLHVERGVWRFYSSIIFNIKNISNYIGLFAHSIFHITRANIFAN